MRLKIVPLLNFSKDGFKSDCLCEGGTSLFFPSGRMMESKKANKVLRMYRKGASCKEILKILDPVAEV
jgi:hypothetical protein